MRSGISTLPPKYGGEDLVGFMLGESGSLIRGTPANLRGDKARLLQASLARATWGKYRTGWKTFKQFEEYTNKKSAWPIPKQQLQDFVVYCMSKRNMKGGTVRTYLAALAHLHRLKGMDDANTRDPVVTALIKGGMNIMVTEGKYISSRRRAMTLPLLRILGHNLSRTGWAKQTTQCIWSCCLVAFFGTFRMGELLAPTGYGMDPSTTLTWADITERGDGSFLIHVKMPKTGTIEGEFVDIFPYPDRDICPAAALRRHHMRQREVGLGRRGDPVFSLRRGKLLTMQQLNMNLRVLLKDTVDPARDSISCHSFRAGLPSLIAQHPDLMDSEDVKGWGRWSSEAYQRYTRLKLDQKKKIYGRILEILQ